MRANRTNPSVSALSGGNLGGKLGPARFLAEHRGLPQMQFDFYQGVDDPDLRMAVEVGTGLPGHVDPKNWKPVKVDRYELAALEDEIPADIEDHGFFILQAGASAMTVAKVIGLLSAAAGAVGTLLLFFGSFAYEQPPAYFTKEMADGLRERNRRRQRLRRVGLGFLMLSFVLGGISVIVG
jgi:hypothetical protein